MGTADYGGVAVKQLQTNRPKIECAFETKSLLVYEAFVLAHPTDSIHRWVYFAFRKDVDCPYPVAFITVTAARVEMAQTNDLHRRKGFAKELWLGLESYLGSNLHGDAVTKAGVGLLDSLGEPARGFDATDD
jgi:hypothetical protein